MYSILHLIGFNLLDRSKNMFNIFVKPKNVKHFFLFANSDHSENIQQFLMQSQEFHSIYSTSILFNAGLPLDYYPAVANHGCKWIFFRMMGNTQNYSNIFRDLSLLKKYQFDKFFFIPDFLDPSTRAANRYRKPFYYPTMDYLVSNNIDTSHLSHIGLFDPDILAKTKQLYTTNKTLSSGLWIYLYLKGKYPNSTFTLLGYSSDLNEQYHDSSFEKAFLLSQILTNQCNSVSCFDRT